MMVVPEGEYLVFEHGPFDFETENRAVEAQMKQAMKAFDYGVAGCCLDTTPGPFAFIQQSGRPERAVLANLLQNGI